MNEPNTAEAPASAPRWRKPVLFLAVLVALFAAARLVDLGDLLAGLREGIHDLGPWGPVVYIAAYVLLAVFMVPGTIPTAAAGGLFGTLWGTVYVSIGATLGAAVGFLVARHFARNAAVAWLEGKAAFRRIDRLTERNGVWIVAITRLLPIFPYNLLNYGFGLTRVRFGPYVLASWLCMLPGTVLYVVGADAVVSALTSGEVPWPLIGAALIVAVTLLGLGRYARGRLRRAEAETEVEAEIDPPGGG